MRRQFAFLVAGLVVVLVLAGQLARAAAGPEPNDIQDSLPAWASDGVHVAFGRSAAHQTSRVLEMAAGGRGVHIVGDGILRGWLPGTQLVLVQVDGEHTLLLDDWRKDRPVAEFLGTDASASPDGSRVAYLRAGTLYVARADGTGERAVASNVNPPSWDLTGPAWSPDGRQIAVASGSRILLVQADGTGTSDLWDGSGQNVNPTWSHDGTTIAFETNAGPHWEIWTASPGHSFSGASPLLRSATANYRYPQFSPVSNELAFISDRQHLRGGATPYQYALYVTDPNPAGAAHKLVDDVHPFSPARWSPTAALIAVAAGQECRRWGIYVTRSDVGSRAHRRSNICRFDGTPGADRITGSPYFDIVNGLGGNDVLNGAFGNDKISGNGGNDTILGGPGDDFILAGPGDDVVYGGTGNDVIVPGNGRDRIDCGPGVDTVEGAGPLDRIAKNCEHVRR